MKDIHLSKVRFQRMRLFTLLCFFHFSALNNGYTYLMVSCTGIEKLNFAPVLIEKFVTPFNPKNWAALSSGKKWLSLFFRSSQVIEYASQSAIQNMLNNSALLQIWLNQSLRETLSRNSLKQGTGKTMRQETWGKKDTFTQSKNRYELEKPMEYLKMEQEESWLKMRRFHFWDWKKFKVSRLAQFCKGTVWKSEGLLNQDGELRSAIIKKLIKDSELLVKSGNFRMWIVYLFNRDSDEFDSALIGIAEKSALMKIILP